MLECETIFLVCEAEYELPHGKLALLPFFLKMGPQGGHQDGPFQ